MANVIYNSFKLKVFTNGVNGLNWTDPGTEVRVMLMANTYTPNEDTHTLRSEIKTNEISTGGNYTRGGAILPTKSTSVNTATNTITLTAASVTWASSTITNARYAVLYIPTSGTGDSSEGPLIACYDFGVDKSSSNDNFTFIPNASGLLTLS